MDPRPGGAGAAASSSGGNAGGAAAGAGAGAGAAGGAAEAEDELLRRLYSLDSLYHRPQSVARLEVTVHRANNIELDSIGYGNPQATVCMGEITRESPKDRAYGRSPVFDWRTELAYSGVETHLVFQVRVGNAVVGSTLLPLAEVFAQERFSKALPLLRAGHTRAGQSDDDRATELLVTVVCFPHTQPPPDAAPGAALAAEQLRDRCTQLRVTLRSLTLTPSRPSEKPGSLRPYVRVTTSIQREYTMVAYAMTTRVAEEFVFVDPRKERFECGGLFRGQYDKYEGPLRPEPKGSAAIPAYRKMANGELKVTYRDVRFLFWHVQQNTFEFDVFDDRMFKRDVLLATATLDLTEALQMPFSQGAAATSASSIATAASTGGGLAHKRSGPIQLPLKGVAMQTDHSGPGVVGSIEVEVEFIEAPLALPSPLEPLFKRLAQLRTEKAEQHRAALDALRSILYRNSRDGFGFMESVEALPPDVRTSLANVLAVAATAGERQALRHEHDASAMQGRLEDTLRVTFAALRAPEERMRAALEAAADAMPLQILPDACQDYSTKCAAAQLDPFLPMASLIADRCRTVNGYGAALRGAILDAAGVLRGGGRGRLLVQLIERHCTKIGAAVPPVPGCIPDVPSATEIARFARDVSREELEAAAVAQRAQMDSLRAAAGSFFPTIRGSSGQKPHPGDKAEVVPEDMSKVNAGSVSLGLLGGLLGGLSTVTLAKLIHRLDDEIFCAEKYKDVPGFHPMCRLMSDSNADEVLANYIATKHGFGMFFLLYFGYMFTFAHMALSSRYGALRELALDPIGLSRDEAGSTHVVLCASGFLSTLADIYNPWAVNADCPWTAGEVIAIRYETSTLLALGNVLTDLVERAKNHTLFVTQAALSCTNPVSLSQMFMEYLLTEIDDCMDRACLLAQQAGVVLARCLVQGAAAGGRRPISLCGFSTGGVLVHSCLRELRRLAQTGQAPFAMDLICDVIIVGAPVPVEDPEEWARLRQLVSGRFINGYSSLDPDLSSLQVRRRAAYAGTRALTEVPGIENLPLMEFINMHGAYARQMPAILTDVTTRY